MSDQYEESWMDVRSSGTDEGERVSPPIGTTVAHSARRYDYWLGGKDNLAADRESGDAIAAAFPTVRTAVVENRRFVRRAAAHLAEQAGIRQFLDIGTGIPDPAERARDRAGDRTRRAGGRRRQRPLLAGLCTRTEPIELLRVLDLLVR